MNRYLLCLFIFALAVMLIVKNNQDHDRNTIYVQEEIQEPDMMVPVQLEVCGEPKRKVQTKNPIETYDFHNPDPRGVS
jgi:hypothetical protein